MKQLQSRLVFILAIGMIGILAACSQQPTPTASMSMNNEDSAQSGEMQMDTKMDMPANLDTATSVMSELGLFKVSYQSSQTAEAINEIFNWAIHVETSDGTPVDNAEISIQALMPQHGHGMPTDPQVTQNLGNGDYKLEGLKYSMPGWWEETLTITTGSQTDVVTFNQVLK